MVIGDKKKNKKTKITKSFPLCSFLGHGRMFSYLNHKYLVQRKTSVSHSWMSQRPSLPAPLQPPFSKPHLWPIASYTFWCAFLGLLIGLCSLPERSCSAFLIFLHMYLHLFIGISKLFMSIFPKLDYAVLKDKYSDCVFVLI